MIAAAINPSQGCRTIQGMTATTTTPTPSSHPPSTVQKPPNTTSTRRHFVFMVAGHPSQLNLPPPCPCSHRATCVPSIIKTASIVTLSSVSISGPSR
eukprot:scaffold19122_cov23-Cyclotella_meneghiniana.AAC.1